MDEKMTCASHVKSKVVHMLNLVPGILPSTVGVNTITQKRSSKLLGVQIDDSETWDKQINDIISNLKEYLSGLTAYENKISDRVGNVA